MQVGTDFSKVINTRKLCKEMKKIKSKVKVTMVAHNYTSLTVYCRFTFYIISASGLIFKVSLL